MGSLPSNRRPHHLPLPPGPNPAFALLMRYLLCFFLTGLCAVLAACSTEIEDPFGGTSGQQVGRLQLNNTSTGADDTLTADGERLLPCRVILDPKYILHEDQTITVSSAGLHLSATNSTAGASASQSFQPSADTVLFWVVAPRDHAPTQGLEAAVQGVKMFGSVKLFPSLPDEVALTASVPEATVNTTVTLNATLRTTVHAPRKVSGNLPVFFSLVSGDTAAVTLETSVKVSEATDGIGATANITATASKAGIYTFKAESSNGKVSRIVTVEFVD